MLFNKIFMTSMSLKLKCYIRSKKTNKIKQDYKKKTSIEKYNNNTFPIKYNYNTHNFILITFSVNKLYNVHFNVCVWSSI